MRVAIAAAGREGSEAGTGGAQLLACARPCGGMGTGDQPPE
jgi:hypothetical protein